MHLLNKFQSIFILVFGIHISLQGMHNDPIITRFNKALLQLAQNKKRLSLDTIKTLFSASSVNALAVPYYKMVKEFINHPHVQLIGNDSNSLNTIVEIDTALQVDIFLREELEKIEFATYTPEVLSSFLIEYPEEKWSIPTKNKFCQFKKDNPAHYNKVLDQYTKATSPEGLKDSVTKQNFNICPSKSSDKEIEEWVDNHPKTGWAIVATVFWVAGSGIYAYKNTSQEEWENHKGIINKAKLLAKNTGKTMWNTTGGFVSGHRL